MKHLDYTAGFLIDTLKTHIVLVHKNRGPKSIIGKWTGVGGKIEPGESPAEAQEREFREEAGLEISDWKPFAFFHHYKYELNFFVAFRSIEELFEVQTMEDEEIKVIPIKELHKYDVAYGASFLIPLALADFVEYPIHFDINNKRED